MRTRGRCNSIARRQREICHCCSNALRTHFHIDLDGGSEPSNRGRPRGSLNPLNLLTIDVQLSFMNQVYEDALFVLLNASIREGRVFYSLGVQQSKDRNLVNVSGGVRHFPKGSTETILVTFPPRFTFRSAAMCSARPLRPPSHAGIRTVALLAVAEADVAFVSAVTVSRTYVARKYKH